MTRRQVGRYLAGPITVLAILGTSSAVAAGGVPVNAAAPAVGRADHQDQYALDVAQPVVAAAGTWTGALAYSYRFWRCPTSTFDASCAALGGWQPELQTTYDRASAGQYAVVEVQAHAATGASAPVASPAKLLTVPAALNAAGIHLTGGLPDGTIVAGTSADVRFDQSAITGVPTPTVAITWSVGGSEAGSDAIERRDIPYTGPLPAPRTVAGERLGIGATVTITNPGGVATGQPAGLDIRAAPLLTNACFCDFDRSPLPPLRLVAGDRIPIRELALGTQLGIPRLVAGTPAPRVTIQWLRCRRSRCSVIPRATKDSYSATRRDIGYTVRVRVTARNQLGAFSVDLLTPGGVPVGAAPPTVPKHRSQRP